MRPAPFGVSQLNKFLEDLVVLVDRDARSGIPYLNANPRPIASVSDENASFVRVPHGIGHEVAEDALDQDRVRLKCRAAVGQYQFDPLVSRFARMIEADPASARSGKARR